MEPKTLRDLESIILSSGYIVSEELSMSDALSYYFDIEKSVGLDFYIMYGEYPCNPSCKCKKFYNFIKKLHPHLVDAGIKVPNYDGLLYIEPNHEGDIISEEELTTN